MLIRPMRPDDLEAVEAISADAFYELDVRTRPPDWPKPERRPPSRTPAWLRRLAHLLTHDPAGAWVAEDDGGTVVGEAAASVREGLWGLSSFAVVPDLQAKGTGKRLLDASLGAAPATSPGLICSSHDPRAVRLYRLAGFDIEPAMLLAGNVRRSALPAAVSGVRDGTPEDVELFDAIDRSARGHGHGVDHGLMIDQFPARVLERGTSRAYTYLYGSSGPYLLAATDPGAATDLLWSAFGESDPTQLLDFHNVTAQQVWAIDAGLAAGLELHQHGYVMRRNLPPPAPYIPSGHFL